MNISQHQFIGISVPTEAPEFLPEIIRECRICLIQQDHQEFVEPCLCSGSLQHVHFKCLEKWISHSSPSLLRKKLPLYAFKCEMCKENITFQCQLITKCCNLQQFKEKVSLRFKIFIVLALLTLTCLILVIVGSILTNQQKSTTQTQSFTFTIVLACTLIIGILFCILIYVWIVDFFIKQKRSITTVHNVKRKVARKRSLAVIKTVESAVLTNKSKTTGTRMTVYPQFVMDSHIQ